MKALLKVWIAAKSERAARIVAGRIQKRLLGGSDFVRAVEYDKGGYEVHFHIPLNSKEWVTAVYELIQRAQSHARQWIISSTIEEEVYMISNEVPVPGVASAHLIMQKEVPVVTTKPT